MRMVWSTKASVGSSMVLFGGMTMVVSARDGIFLWLAMEIMSLGFLGLVASNGSSGSAAGTYFVPNSFGSLFFLMGVIGSGNSLWDMVGGAGVAMKLGVIPLHFWVLTVASTLSGELAFVLLGPLKLGPLVGLSCSSMGVVYFLVGVVSGVVGSILGACQKSMMSVVVYSGISSAGWLLSCCTMSRTSALLFWFLYTITLGGALLNRMGGSGFLVLLGGIPAGPVFLAKWLVLSEASVSVPWVWVAGLGVSVVFTAAMFLKIVVGMWGGAHKSMWMVGTVSVLMSVMVLVGGV